MNCKIIYEGVEYDEKKFEALFVTQELEGLDKYLPSREEGLRIVDANWMIYLTDKPA